MIRARTNYFKVFLSLCVTLLLFMVQMPGVVHATGDVPENAPVYSQEETEDPGKPDKPDANDIFGDATVGPDETGYADGAGEVLGKVVSLFVKIANYLFAFALIVHFTTDALMMAFPMFATLFATKIPIQLFSNECAQVCGVKYSYKPGGGAGVGGASGGVGTADASGGVGSAADGKKKGFIGKVIPYARERLVTLIICGSILVMSFTGILPWIINTAINWLIGLFIK